MPRYKMFICLMLCYVMKYLSISYYAISRNIYILHIMLCHELFVCFILYHVIHLTYISRHVTLRQVICLLLHIMLCLKYRMCLENNIFTLLKSISSLSFMLSFMSRYFTFNSNFCYQLIYTTVGMYDLLGTAVNAYVLLDITIKEYNLL